MRTQCTLNGATSKKKFYKFSVTSSASQSGSWPPTRDVHSVLCNLILVLNVHGGASVLRHFVPPSSTTRTLHVGPFHCILKRTSNQCCLANLVSPISFTRDFYLQYSFQKRYGKPRRNLFTWRKCITHFCTKPFFLLITLGNAL